MHLFCSGHVSLFLQLQLVVLVTCGWLFLIMRVLCFEIMFLTLFMQLKLTLTVFRLKILCNLWPAGKCVSTIYNTHTTLQHNTRIIRKSQQKVTNTTSCNCRNKETCPLQNKCMSKDIVYKATISTCNTNDTKHYIGMTSNTSKRCNFCLEEKLSILKEKSKYLLNKRSEIVSACHHKNKFQVNHLTKKGMHGI